MQEQTQKPVNTGTINEITIIGKVVVEPKITHSLFCENFCEFYVEVKRDSGKADVLPVVVSERLLAKIPQLEINSNVLIKGDVRTHNIKINEQNRLIINVFVKDITLYEGIDNPVINEMIIEGYVCKPPIYRTTPFNREITDLHIAVNGKYNKSYYIPCIVWGRNAKFAQTLQIGQRVQLKGRLQSREYTKNDEKRVAYEMSASIIKIDKVEVENGENK